MPAKFSHFVQSHRTDLVLGLTIFLVVVLILSRIVTIQGLCGFKLGYLAKEKGLSKEEWACYCLGKAEKVSSSYFEKELCTGINLSNIFHRQCQKDSDCKSYAQECFEDGGSGVISLTPFCLQNECRCECGWRDRWGRFVKNRNCL